MEPRHIVITGASSGIGKALALACAKPEACLYLSGTNETRLQEIAGTCRNRGAAVQERILDVTDRTAMQTWIMEIDRNNPIDLIIANAGISGGIDGSVMEHEDPAQIRRIFDVNLQGVINTIDPALPAMIKRGRGQIAVMSSLAGFRGWPGAPSYCASKAAVKVYGEGLRGALKNSGVKINVICPGFVRTPMTDKNKYPMPFLISSEKAAQIIIKGLKSNKGRISFPWQTAFFAWLFGCLPDRISGNLLKNTPGKTPIKL